MTELNGQGVAELITAVAAGDTDAFEKLLEKTRQYLQPIVYGVLLSHDLSEDTLQEVYLQVWATAGSFDPQRGSATAWLRTIAHRRAVDKVRHEQAFRERQARLAYLTYVPDHDHVSESVQNTSEIDALTAALTSLSPLQHEAITLAFHQGLGYPEVAESLNELLPTVKSRIRAALTHLRSALSDADPTTPPNRNRR